jgi:hypothetical protein
VSSLPSLAGRGRGASRGLIGITEIEALEAAGDTHDPRYTELLMEHHYVHHFLRKPPEEWPDEVDAR